MKKFSWSEAIWSLIKAGEVAIGMDESMLDVTCDFRYVQGKFLEATNEGSKTYDVGVCSNYGRQTKFLMSDGKVQKYVR